MGKSERTPPSHGSAKTDTTCDGNDCLAEQPTSRTVCKNGRFRRRREKETKFRLKRKTSKLLIEKVDDGLLNSIIKTITLSARGKRTYAPTLVELVAILGSSTSDGGARPPIDGVIRHIEGGNVHGVSRVIRARWRNRSLVVYILFLFVLMYSDRDGIHFRTSKKDSCQLPRAASATVRS